jgi:hypothetical protein
MFAIAATVAICANLVVGGLHGEALIRAYSTWVPTGIGALLVGIAMVTVAMWYALYREYDDFMDLLRGQVTPDRPNLPRAIHIMLGGHIPEDVQLSHEVSAAPIRWWGVVIGLVPIAAALVATVIGPATRGALHSRYPAPLGFMHPLAWAAVLTIVAWGVTLIVGAILYAGPHTEAWDEILDEVLV